MFPPFSPRTPPLYALHRRKQSILSFPMHARMPAFLPLFVCGRSVLSLLHKGNRTLGTLPSDCGMICSKSLTMSLISASLRVTVSQLIFCFVALFADDVMVIPQNSASTTCRFKNIFIFNVGRCARSTVRGREHSLTCRPLWHGYRGDNQC